MDVRDDATQATVTATKPTEPAGKAPAAVSRRLRLITVIATFGGPASARRPGTFFLFVVAGIFSFTFVKLYVPETRGRTLETLEAELRARFS
ncbi:hypothetical protein ACWET9_30575 [Streptomyces sp. NPDC004059]